MGARAISMAAEKYLGKPIVVENRGGGGGTLALAVVATQKPDGYTLCAATATGIVRAPMMQKVPYKPLKELYPDSGLHLSPQRIGRKKRCSLEDL